MQIQLFPTLWKKTGSTLGFIWFHLTTMIWLGMKRQSISTLRGNFRGGSKKKKKWQLRSSVIKELVILSSTVATESENKGPPRLPATCEWLWKGRKREGWEQEISHQETEVMWGGSWGHQQLFSSSEEKSGEKLFRSFKETLPSWARYK